MSDVVTYTRVLPMFIFVYIPVLHVHNERKDSIVNVLRDTVYRLHEAFFVVIASDGFTINE